MSRNLSSRFGLYLFDSFVHTSIVRTTKMSYFRQLTPSSLNDTSKEQLTEKNKEKLEIMVAVPPIRTHQPLRRLKRNTHHMNTNGGTGCSLHLFLVYGIVGMILVYITVMVTMARFHALTSSTTTTSSAFAAMTTNDQWPSVDSLPSKYLTKKLGDSRVKPIFSARKEWGKKCEKSVPVLE